MFDYSKLKGRITEKSETQKTTAKAIGITPTALASKLNMGRGFKAEQIRSACTFLDIPDEKIGEYFFCLRV